jgi:hypothetical protein
MDIKFPCQQSNPQTKTSSGIDSFFVPTRNYDEEIFSDVFKSIHISETSDIQSTKSQSFSRSHYSSSNSQNY